jgi:hypothetical protein
LSSIALASGNHYLPCIATNHLFLLFLSFAFLALLGGRGFAAAAGYYSSRRVAALHLRQSLLYLPMLPITYFLFHSSFSNQVDVTALQQQGITVADMLQHYIFVTEFLWEVIDGT